MKFDVQGMTCGHCERSIKTAIAALGGTADVDRAAGSVEVHGVDDAARARGAIEAEGYEVTDPGVAHDPG